MSNLLLFLPSPLVKLVFKISQMFGINSYDEFSLLENLQNVLLTKFLSGLEFDEKETTLTIVSIIRLSEKFNNNNSKLNKEKLNSIFVDFEIDDFKSAEFRTFREMNFEFKSPQIVELIYKLIEKYLVSYKRDILFELSLDVLRLVYCSKSLVYEL